MLEHALHMHEGSTLRKHPFMVCEEQRMVLSPVAWSNALPLLVCIVCLGPGSALHRMWRGDHTSRDAPFVLMLVVGARSMARSRDFRLGPIRV